MQSVHIIFLVESISVTFFFTLLILSILWSRFLRCKHIHVWLPRVDTPTSQQHNSTTCMYSSQYVVLIVCILHYYAYSMHSMHHNGVLASTLVVVLLLVEVCIVLASTSQYFLMNQPKYIAKCHRFHDFDSEKSIGIERRRGIGSPDPNRDQPHRSWGKQASPQPPQLSAWFPFCCPQVAPGQGERRSPGE